MDFKLDVSCLQGQIVTLPGGRDKKERPFILINLPPESSTLDVVPPLTYLLSILSHGTKKSGISVIIDARKCPWKVARLCLRQTNSVFRKDELADVLVLRPDGFWDNSRVEICASTYKFNQEVLFIPRSRLNKFVESSQLPTELGGNFIYNHNKWFQNRQRVEDFYKNAEYTKTELTNLQKLISNNLSEKPDNIEELLNDISDRAEASKMMVGHTISTGQELLQNIEYDNLTRKFASEYVSLSTTQETLDTIEKVDAILSDIKQQQQKVEESWVKIEQGFIDTKDLSNLEEGIVKVTDWILGPAEKLLNSNQKVGYDVSSAEELRREHEVLELQCWETYGTYAKIIYKVNRFSKMTNLSPMHKDLISRKEFMDFVCKSFALRMERRRNILITSLRFFRLVSEYFDKTGEVFDSLVMGDKSIDFTNAEKQLKSLREGQETLDAVKRDLVKEGEKLSDMLSMPVKDALGRDVSVDYSEDIVNIRDILDATIARKNIFSDSLELQKLTLGQVTHINNYEKDVAQAIQWLNDLFKVMLKNHGHVGCSVPEIQAQKDDQLIFQETAKDTYSYGCQLLNAALSLRQSCKLPLDEHEILTHNLKTSWCNLLSVSQEQITRLRVSAVFHRSVEEHCNQLRDLREAVAMIPLMEIVKKRARIRYYFSLREKLLIEVGRMVRLGRLLRSRLREPLHVLDINTSSSWFHGQNVDEPETKNIEAIEAITERLNEITEIAEELDLALQSAQQDCLVLTTAIAMDHSNVPTIKTSDEKEKPVRPDDLKSDDEFQTASECTLQHSRSSSYNTASECEHRYSPWWEPDKNATIDENISNEKMVLAVGLPELPEASSVLKSSPEVPPGKIVHEVTETTHLKVKHSHSLGVSSFVLTSETVRDNRHEGYTGAREESAKVVETETTVDKNLVDDDLIQRLNEVGSVDSDAWRKYHSVTKQALRGFI